jgi:hypothetical protein
VLDFETGIDRIELDHAIFRKLAPGVLPNDSFVIGSKAKDGADHVVYDDRKGLLLYDADGKGGEDAVAFLKVGKGTEIGFGDILVV